MMEPHKRTLVRMLTYRVTGFFLTILFTWFMTGTLEGAVTYSLWLHVLLAILYYIHERIWLKVEWLKK